MDWIDRMEMAYEAQTDRMIDEMYAPRAIECAMCEEYFNSDDALETKYDSKFTFVPMIVLIYGRKNMLTIMKKGSEKIWTTSFPFTQPLYNQSIQQSKKQVDHE